MSIAQVRQYMVDGDGDAAVALVNDMLAKGTAAQEIMNGLTEEMGILGQKFENFEVFLPDLMIAGDAFMQIMSVLKEHLVAAADGTAAKTVIIGTVKGDLHDIGKNLVKIMMEGSGIEVYDLGTDVSAEQFVETAVEHDCGIIACSSLLTTTMNEMRRVVSLAQEKGIRKKVRILIGGAPISQSFCDEIGADVYTEDAGAAARAAVEMLKTCQNGK